ALLLLIVLAVSILTASSEFETYRLYPFPGSNIGLLTRQAFSQSGAFLPALLSLLITCTGLQGTHHAKKAGVIAALISAAVCAAAQLAVSLAFTYTELGDLFMPLFRINNLKSIETHLLRMDKLAHIAWLTGGMLTGSFYIYSASLLFSQVFGVRDIRPVLSSNVLLVGLLIIIDFEGIMRFLPDPRAANAEYGFIFIAVPTVLAAFIGAVSAKKRRKHS
ncbi:MAG TPA: GerAB/ArcD/ProY family transporter, partial [Clostridia bacterium]|nr:GerAB/ArcD/ProY family transporter [Clostridia bacterium]